MFAWNKESCFEGNALLYREQQFELQAKYSADSPIPPGFDQDIGRFMLGPPKAPAAGDKPKLKVCLYSLSRQEVLFWHHCQYAHAF